MAAANRHEPKELCSVEFVIKFALQIDISINYQERTVIFNMVDTNDFSVFGIAPYYFFAGIGLMLAFAYFILNISLLGKPVNRNAVILLISLIGLGAGAIGFGYLTKICIALYTRSPITNALSSKVGIVFYGGLTGFILTFLILQKLINKVIDRTTINVFAVAIPLFHAFARVGCFFAGCCYGKKVDTFISVDYVLRGSTEVISVFPVQLAEASLNLILFFILWYILVKHPQKNILPIYLISYATYRFLLEFLRGDANRGVFGFLSFSQIYSLLIILAVSVTLFREDNKNETV